MTPIKPFCTGPRRTLPATRATTNDQRAADGGRYGSIWGGWQTRGSRGETRQTMSVARTRRRRTTHHLNPGRRGAILVGRKRRIFIDTLSSKRRPNSAEVIEPIAQPGGASRLDIHARDIAVVGDWISGPSRATVSFTARAGADTIYAAMTPAGPHRHTHAGGASKNRLLFSRGVAGQRAGHAGAAEHGQKTSPAANRRNDTGGVRGTWAGVDRSVVRRGSLRAPDLPHRQALGGRARTAGL